MPLALKMNPDLEMGTRSVDRANVAQDGPGFNAADAETANTAPLSGQQVPPGNAETTNTTPISGPQVAGNGPEGVGLSLPRVLESIKSLPRPWTLPTGPSIRSWKGLLWRMGAIDIMETKDESAEGRLKIGVLHQYNILWARSRLLRHYLR